MLSFPAQNWRTGIGRALNRPTNLGLRDIRCASKIQERLYLSDYFTANSKEQMEELGITHVISAMDHQLALSYPIPDGQRLFIPIADRSDVDILSHLDQTTAFIVDALKESESNKVLVHCMQGISRSATVVCAYLIATEEMEAHEAVDHVQSLRKVVCPNLGFRLQLVQYSERVSQERDATGKPKPPGKWFIQRFRKLLTPSVPKSRPPQRLIINPIQTHSV